MRKPRAEKVMCQQTAWGNRVNPHSCLHAAGPSGYCKRHDPERIAARKVTQDAAQAAKWYAQKAARERLAAIAHADAAIVTAALALPVSMPVVARVNHGLPLSADEVYADALARLANAVRARRALGTGDAP